MTYTAQIYKHFNITYLDFLEQNLFRDIRKEIADPLEQYLEEGIIKERSDVDLYDFDFLKKDSFSDLDFKESFYLGHLEIKSLLDTEGGAKLCFNIIENRSKKLDSLLANFKKVFKRYKARNNISPQYLDTLYSEYIAIYNNKNILPYSFFLEKYAEHKNDTKLSKFYKDFVDTKKGYIDFLLSSNKPTQTFIKKKLESYIPNKERHKHTYITAGTGGGKSELIKGLIYSVLQTQKNKKDSKKENFILLEPHGDLSTEVFNLCSLIGVKTVILDPFLSYELTPVINPFDFEGNETELNSYSEELLAVFKEVLGTEFTLNAEALLMPCLTTLLKIENSSLYDLQSFMNDEENKELVNIGKVTKNFSHKNFFETNFYSPNLNSTKRAIFLKLQTLLNNKTFSNLTTGKTTIDIENIMNNNYNLIIKLNKKKMRGTLEPFGRFIISRVQSAALKRAEISESKRPKTHLFLDEFQNFISPTIEEILTESRKYKLFLTMAHQVITQLEESKLKDIVLSNSNIKIVGKNGQKTLTVLSKEIRVKVEEMEKLKVGEFYTKVGNSNAFKFYHRLVDKSLFTFSDKAEKKLEENLNFGYVKPTARKVIIKTDRKKDLVNDIIKDKNSQEDSQGEETKPRLKKAARKPKFDNF